jgi:hypothetical protein
VEQELKAVQAAVAKARRARAAARRRLDKLTPDLSKGPRIRSEKGAF